MRTWLAIFAAVSWFASLAFGASLACDMAQLQSPPPQPSSQEWSDAPSPDAAEDREASYAAPFEGGANEDATLTPPPWIDDDDAGEVDATGPPFDAGPEGACAEPVGPGDLAIVEILIASITGTGDHGEWLEVRSTRGCALDLISLHGECAVGAKVMTVDVTMDQWLPAYGSFVLADSTDPAVNHALPGMVLAWAGDPGDVLRNQGTTVTLLSDRGLVDSITYPPLKVAIGASLAFPSDCARGVRADWSRWRPSSSAWFPGFFGTPNAPNDDVHCPDD